jgi:hypothetical protein
MVETKYGKYLIEEPIEEGRQTPRLKFYCQDYFGDKEYSMMWNCIKDPFLMVEVPHSHDFDQFLHFYGGNPLDVSEFDAVVELSLGEECEKHVITKTTIVHVPKGMIHCPLEFKVVNKPIIFMNVALTSAYMR